MLNTPGARVEKGQELARFNLGSTVILVCAPGAATLGAVAVGQEVSMGTPLGRLCANPDRGGSD